MSRATLDRATPFVALGLGVLAFLIFFVWALRKKGLAKRPILLGGAIVSALPALYVGLVWTELLSESYLRLARPGLTLVTMASGAFVAARLTTLRAEMGKGRRRLVDLLAMTATFLAAMAAAGPEIGRPLDRMTVLVAIDRSRSIDLVPNAEKLVRAELQVAELGMREDDRIGVIAFAAEAATEDPPRPKTELASPQRVALGRDGTDLSAAIRRALAEVPPDSAARIVLVSDGVVTRGDTMSAAAAAVAAGLPVDVVPLEQRAVPDIRVVSVRIPTRADEGETMDLRVVTSAPSPAEIEVRIKRDGELIERAKTKIAAGEDVLRIREKAPGPGLHRYDVEITALDPRLDETAEDNSGSAFVRVRGQAAALVLEGDPGKGAFIAHALSEAAFRVDQGTGASFPSDLGGLATYDLIVLSDVRAPDLSPGQIDALASYVRDLGGGLILMGGDRGMGPGGYAKTPLEEVSPVAFDLKQERRRANLAEVIGIDISGSMGAEAGGHTKLELANEAAARSAALLGEGDNLGVEHVDTTVHWSVPLGPVKDKPAIDKAIRGVGVGGGGIYVDITLDAGYDSLLKQKVMLKHMLLFADGSDAERMTGCEKKVADAYSSGVTTSVVALGNGSDVPELEKLSRLGHGRFYLVEDATRLPAVFSQETILAARSAIIEKDFHAAKGAPSEITRGVDFDAAPDLKGYVVTIAKPRASVLLTGPDGDPLLAVWPAGVGRAAAFTSDLKDRWGRAWTTWPGAARLIAQTARDVTRKGEDGRVRLEADASGGELHVRATVVGDDGRAQSFRRLVVHVGGPEGFSREMALEATGAGAYAATIPLSRPGTYIAVARDELSGEAVGTTGAALTAGEELRPTGSDLALLSRIAELTGGKRRATLDGIFADRAAKRFAYKDATAWIVALAAFAMLLAVAARRLAMPVVVEAFVARQIDRVRSRPSRYAKPARDATFDALLQAKERARERDTAAEAARAGAGRTPAPAARPVTPAHAPVQGSHASTHAAPTPPPATTEIPAAPAARQLTAAEILLAKRRGGGPPKT